MVPLEIRTSIATLLYSLVLLPPIFDSAETEDLISGRIKSDEWFAEREKLFKERIGTKTYWAVLQWNDYRKENWFKLLGVFSSRTKAKQVQKDSALQFIYWPARSEHSEQAPLIVKEPDGTLVAASSLFGYRDWDFEHVRFELHPIDPPAEGSFFLTLAIDSHWEFILIFSHTNKTKLGAQTDLKNNFPEYWSAYKFWDGLQVYSPSWEIREDGTINGTREPPSRQYCDLLTYQYCENVDAVQRIEMFGWWDRDV